MLQGLSRSRPIRILLVAGAVFFCSAALPAPSMNGFDLRGASIPIAEIHHGGPEKDGIPAIDRPDFLSSGFASFLKMSDPVLGLVVDGAARAYPIRILNWHEVVNDRFGQQPVVVTYCPLCGTSVAFDARVGGRELDFGVSGLLYNSDVLLYDRQTESLWSQLLGQAISGPLQGQRLTTLPLIHTTWGDWKRQNPQTRVLSTRTGQARPYQRNPYDGYETSEALYFPVAFRSAGFHPKERVLGISIGGQHKAFPFVELEKAMRRSSPSGAAFEFQDSLAGQSLRIRFDPAVGRATAHDAQGAQLPAVVGFWFAWYAFHPDTAIYRVGER
jgi:hypothetical protein